MVGPAVGIGLHRHGHAGGVQPVGEPEGHQDAGLGPVLLSPDRQGGGGEEAAVVEADLTLLHLDRAGGELGAHTPEEGLVQGQLPGAAVKIGQHIAFIVGGIFHKALLSREGGSGRVRGGEHLGAVAAGAGSRKRKNQGVIAFRSGTLSYHAVVFFSKENRCVWEENGVS